MEHPHPDPPGNGLPEDRGGVDRSPDHPHRRQPRADASRRPRHTRHRGSLPVGEAFVSRLGPAAAERFVRMDGIAVDALVAPAPAPGTRIDDIRFVALDCETTGQSPHRLVELGATAFTMHEELEKFETLVHSNDRINRFAERIHRITSNSLAGAPRIEPVIERFRHFAGGSVLVEHSADAFDTRLIAKSIGDGWEVVNLDTSRLAGKLWDLKDTIGLERLCRELGVIHRRPHHALADAEATAGCFVALVRLGQGKFGWGTLQDLVAAGQPPPPRLVTLAGGITAPRPGPPVLPRGPDAPARRRRRGGRRRRGPDAIAADGNAEGGPLPGPASEPGTPGRTPPSR